jgi:RND superfamily putative drug exporter
VARIGRLPAGRFGRWFVVAAWIVAVAAAIPLGGKLSSQEAHKKTVELPRGAGSTFVAGVLDRFPDGQSATGLVVYVDMTGISSADRAKAESDRAAFARVASGAVGEVITAPGHKALLVTVPLRNADKTLADDAKKVRDQAAAGLPDGLTVRLAGAAGNALDSSDAQAQTARSVTLITVLVIAVILLVTYRSLLLWLLPLLCVGCAYAVSQAVLYALVRGTGLSVDTGNAAVVTVLIFGVGTDYALLLLARYREELSLTADRSAAMAEALRRAGPAVAASGVTVSLSLLCLTAAHVGFNFVLGPTGAIGILCGLLAMVTLLPALLVLLGRWIFWPRIPHPDRQRSGQQRADADSRWARLGAGIARRPRMVWLGAALVLAALASITVGIRTGLDDSHQFVGHPGSIVGQQELTDHFHADRGYPVQVVVNAAAAEETSRALRDVAGVSSVQPALRSTDGALARIDAVLVSPPDSAAAYDTVRHIRAVTQDLPGADAHIGGSTALAADKTEAQAHDRRVVMPLVLGVVFVVLVLLLRALVAPLLLMASVVLSYLAGLGATWLLIDRVLHFQAADDQLVLIGFLFLVALGVDYNIFLVSRVRQAAGEQGHRAGVLTGLTVTGGVITSAGAVLAATFLALTLAPQVAFIEIGVLVAVGVLIDTFVVRSVLVPALAWDVGERFWWPGRLGPSER